MRCAFFNLISCTTVAPPSASRDAAAGSAGLYRARVSRAGDVYLLKPRGQKMFCTALALILGGALGNVIDRCVRT